MNSLLGMVALCVMILAGMTMMSACHKSKDGDVPAAAAEDDGMLHTIVAKDGEVWVPGMTIDLKFDDETRTKMLEGGETVIVSYIIEAYPEDSVADYDVGFLNSSRNFLNRLSLGASFSLFGPSLLSRAAASSSVSPTIEEPVS